MQSLLLLAALITSPVYTEPGEIPRLKVVTDKKTEDLPLEFTHVKANILGYAARVEVTQRYKNPSDHPIEAIYIFPLPENSAVDDMKIIIGSRIIKAEIQKRADARRTYETAKAQGKTAALLEQERPNIFTQSVANIAPGSAIDVVIQYEQDLTYDAGEYEFVFPMVVGPRFSPPGAVADVARIMPPYMGEGQRSGNDISIEVTANAGLPIKHWDAPTHETVITPTFDGTLKLALSKKDNLPNRDFVLHYSVDGKEALASALGERDKNGGFLTLIVQPPKLDVDKIVGNRELIFVVDVSGSMSGVPLAMCKDAMREALRQLRPVDTFNIYSFSGFTGSAFKNPVAANDNNIKQGLEYILSLNAGGGTMMADAVKAALETDVEKGRNRYVFFMTDGYVGNEAQILQQTQKFVAERKLKGQKAKVFGFGVGSSTNRYLLDGFGKEGEGLTVYATTREDPTAAVNKFYRYIDNAILEDVKIDWNGLAVSEVYPARVPDLFASHPLTVHARTNESGKHKIFIKGTAQGKEFSLPVEVEISGEKKEKSALATLWARSKITDLERNLWTSEDSATVNAITELGLNHRLVTRYTSFVAVDPNSKVDGKLQTIMQPADAPEGVDMVMAGGHPMAAAPSKTYMYKGGANVQGQATGYAISGSGSGGGGRGYAPATKAAPPENQRMVLGDRDDGKVKRKEEEKAEKAPQEKPVAVTIGSLRSHQSEVQALVKQHLGASGGITVKLTYFVSPDGKILQPKIKLSSGENKALEDALLKLIKTWTVPNAQGEQTFTFNLPA